jgi:hypothetical protein
MDKKPLWDWFDIVMGMHAIARKSRFLWGLLPAGVVAREVAIAEHVGLTEGLPVPEQIVKRIPAAIREPYSFTRLFENGYGVDDLEFVPPQGLRMKVAGDSLTIFGESERILIEYQKKGRSLALELPPGEEASLKGENAMPRDYARVYRLAVAGEWTRGNIISVPNDIRFTGEFGWYLKLDFPEMFLEPDELEARGR